MANTIDLWRRAIVRRPIDSACHADLSAEDVVWLQRPSRFRFIADPFGNRCEDTLSVFAETMRHLGRKRHLDVLIFEGQLHCRRAAVRLRRHDISRTAARSEADGDIFDVPGSAAAQPGGTETDRLRPLLKFSGNRDRIGCRPNEKDKLQG